MNSGSKASLYVTQNMSDFEVKSTDKPEERSIDKGRSIDKLELKFQLMLQPPKITPRYIRDESLMFIINSGRRIENNNENNEEMSKND